MLRSFDEGEADRVVILLTPGLGKLRARVRGARRMTSRLGGHVDVLTRASLSLALGHRVDIVTGAESMESFGALKADLGRLAEAIYLCELVGALLPDEAPHPVAYAIMLEALRALDGGANPQTVARYAELRLLADTGYAPELRACLACGNEIVAGHHRFAPSLGGVICDVCQVERGQVFPLSVNSLKVLRHFGRVGMTEAVQLGLEDTVHQEMEAALAGSLREVLERQTRSGAFIDHLRSLKVTVPAQT